MRLKAYKLSISELLVLQVADWRGGLQTVEVQGYWLAAIKAAIHHCAVE